MSSGDNEGARPQRCLLNAEIWRGSRAVVAHTTRIWKSGAFIKTAHALPPGVRTRLRLSLGRVVPSIDLTAEVKVTHTETGSGGKRGVEVSFELPSDDASESLRALVARLTAEPDHQTPFHVLLVEDNEILREAFSVAADREFPDRTRRPKIGFAASAEEGERRVHYGSYDILLVDQDLAGEPGAELIRRIRASKKHASMPVIGLTVGGREPQTALRAAGADLCLQKPLVFRDILNTLDRLLPRGQGR